MSKLNLDTFEDIFKCILKVRIIKRHLLNWRVNRSDHSCLISFNLIPQLDSIDNFLGHIYLSTQERD